jgi:hypothetical protein
MMSLQVGQQTCHVATATSKCLFGPLVFSNNTLTRPAQPRRVSMEV